MKHDIASKKICIIGSGGVSGLSLVQLCLKLDANVIAVDYKALLSSLLSQKRIQKALQDQKLQWIQDVQDEKLVHKIKPDLILCASGITPSHPFCMAARKMNIPIQSELEFSLQLIKKLWKKQPTIIAVTGTDGKSTTVSMITAILNQLVPTISCGNIGLPVADLVLHKQQFDILVIECSSFQLEWLDVMHPSIAVITNIAEDHQDRYKSFAEYVQSKLHIFRNQTNHNMLFVGSEVMRYLTPELLANKSIRMIHQHFIQLNQVEYLGRKIFTKFDNRNPLLEGERLQIPFWGIHNWQNLQLALAVSEEVCRNRQKKLSARKIIQAISKMPTLRHRLQIITTNKAGVCFINDSKATTVQATQAALRSIMANGCDGIKVYLLLGGIAKGGDFSQLQDKQVFHYVYGQSASAIAQQLKLTTFYPDLSTALQSLMRDIQSDRNRKKNQMLRVVVLSPGCASFDVYKNYHERGEHFCRLVAEYC